MKLLISDQRLLRQIVVLLVVVLASSLGNNDLHAEDNKTFKYDNILYPDGPVFITRDDKKSPDTWGEIGYYGSDLLSSIENCSSKELPFCINIPNGLHFSYNCTNLQIGSTWLSQGWKFTISPHHSVSSEFLVIASINEKLWHFILSKTHGVVEIVRLEKLNSSEEVNAINIWRASNFGFGNISRYCKG